MRRAVALVVALVFVVVAGCGSRQPGDPSPPANPTPTAPLLVHGGVVDRTGASVAGATVRVQLLDASEVVPGDVVPVIFEATASTTPEGAFAIYAAPDDEVRRLAATNQGIVSFHLDVFAERHGVFFPTAFDRTVIEGGWQGDAPGLVVSPDRVEALP